MLPPHLNLQNQTPSRSPLIAIIVGAALFTAVVGAVFTLRQPKSVNASREAPFHSAASVKSSPAPSPPPPPPTFVVDDTPAPAPKIGGAPSWSTSSGDAPEPMDASDLFALGSEMNGDVSDQLVVCHFQSAGQSDIFFGDDLGVTVTLGNAPPVFNNGPENGNRAYATIPHARLAQGDAAFFHVVDRDAFDDDEIGQRSLTYSRHGLRTSGSGFWVECRALAEPARARVLASRKRDADVALKRVATAKLDVTKPDLGAPRERIHDSETKITDAAVVGGWSDPTVEALLVGHDEAIHTVEDQRANVVRDLRQHAAGKRQAEMSGARVTVKGIACEGDRCTSKITVENLTARTLVFNREIDSAHQSRVSLNAVSEDAWPMHVRTTADGTSIEAHASLEIDVPLPAQSTLLSVCAKTCTTLDWESDVAQ